MRTRCTTLLVIALMLVIALPLAAQSDYSSRRATRNFTLGVFAEGGVSHSFGGDTAQPGTPFRFDAEELSPVFAYRAGVAMTFPFTPTIGATLSLGIDQRGFTSSKQRFVTQVIFPGQDTTPTTAEKTDRITYFSLMPGVQLSAFHLGVNIGMPLGGTRTIADSSYDFADTDKDRLNVMIEPRIGAIIPLLDQESGWLGVMIEAGYALNTISKPYELNDQTIEDPHQLASVHLGLTWQFALGGSGL